MDRQAKTKRWILAAAACAVLAADASIAAERADTAPKSGEAVSHQESLPAGHVPDGGAAANKTGTDTAGQSSGLAGHRNDTGSLAARPSIASTANGRSAKGGTGEAGIDLIRPDDGYANLHRRAPRSSLVAAGQKKKLPPVAVTPHQLSSARIPAEPLRNSAGAAFPISTGIPDSIRTIPGGPVSTGLARNSVGVSPADIHRPDIHLAATSMMPPVTGINGTTMGHAGAGGVGGPAKDRSAINGSALRPRF
jgi:hypothetical protein